MSQAQMPPTQASQPQVAGAHIAHAQMAPQGRVVGQVYRGPVPNVFAAPNTIGFRPMVTGFRTPGIGMSVAGFRRTTSTPMLGPKVFRRVSYTRQGSLDSNVKPGYNESVASLSTISEIAPAVQGAPVSSLQTVPALPLQQLPVHKTPSNSTSNSECSTPLEDYSTISSLSNTIAEIRDELLPELAELRREREERAESDRREALFLSERRREYCNPSLSQSCFDLRNVGSLSSLHGASVDQLSSSVRALEGCPNLDEDRMGPGRTPRATPLMTPRETPQMTPRGTSWLDGGCGQDSSLNTPRMTELEMSLMRAIQFKQLGMTTPRASMTTPRVMEDDGSSTCGGVRSSMPSLSLHEPQACSDRPEPPSLGTPRTFDRPFERRDWRRNTCTNFTTVNDDMTPRMSSGFYDPLSMSYRHLPPSHHDPELTTNDPLSMSQHVRLSDLDALRMAHQKGLPYAPSESRDSLSQSAARTEAGQHIGGDSSAPSSSALRRNDALMKDPGTRNAEPTQTPRCEKMIDVGNSAHQKTRSESLMQMRELAETPRGDPFDAVPRMCEDRHPIKETAQEEASAAVGSKCERVQGGEQGAVTESISASSEPSVAAEKPSSALVVEERIGEDKPETVRSQNEMAVFEAGASNDRSDNILTTAISQLSFGSAKSKSSGYLTDSDDSDQDCEE